jgi:hypothetical protein
VLQSHPKSKSYKYDGLDFTKKAEDTFWKNFPSRRLPRKPTTRINIQNIKRGIVASSKMWTIHEKTRAERAVRHLTRGAPAYQKFPLRGAMIPNAPSATEHGGAFTETLEKWIQQGFVAGPFKTPPTKEFRANSIMAIEQKGKVRPILNLSKPKEFSFNDNVDKDIVPKVRMSSARQFGQSVLAAGEGALMSKMDMRDAYKNIPAKIEELNLQGFTWLGAYFIDTQQIFGAATAVANFDDVAATVLEIAKANTTIPGELVHRTLDDVACVAPAGSGWTENFTEIYKSTCNALNIQLADDCPDKEKAFSCETRGTVLGIQFDTESLSWRLSCEKANDIMSDIQNMMKTEMTDLTQMEKLAGRLSNFSQMCPFLLAFKRPLNKLLAEFGEDYDIMLPVPNDLKNDLKIWLEVVAYSCTWMPICREIEAPPLGVMYFTSDAAGGTGRDDWLGVASLGHLDDKSFWYLCRGKWPMSVRWWVDEKGASLASKMTSLEFIGLLLPVLTVPNAVRGKNLVLGVDNASVVFGWRNRAVKGDLLASSLIRALHLVSVFLECRIFVEHVPRMSSHASIIADSMTRSSTATADVWANVVGVKVMKRPNVLWKWLRNPTVDWNLGLKLIDDLKKKLQ